MRQDERRKPRVRMASRTSASSDSMVGMKRRMTMTASSTGEGMGSWRKLAISFPEGACTSRYTGMRRGSISRTKVNAMGEGNPMSKRTLRASHACVTANASRNPAPALAKPIAAMSTKRAQVNATCSIVLVDRKVTAHVHTKIASNERTLTSRMRACCRVAPSRRVGALRAASAGAAGCTAPLISRYPPS